MKKRKKIIIIVSLLLIGIIILILLFRKSPEPIEPSDSGELPSIATTTEPTEDGLTIVRLSDEGKDVFDFWKDSETNEILYITSNGKIYSGKVGPDPEISDREFLGINKIRYNPDNDKVLIAFGDPKSPSWGVFDTKDRVWRPLPSYIQDIVWGKERVFAVVSSEEGKSLVSFDFEKLKNNTGEHKIILKNFSFKDVDIEYISDNSILIMEKPAAFYKSRVWKLNIENKEISFVLSPEGGLVLNLSNDIIFKYSSEKNNFRVLNNQFENTLPIIFKTFPKKCTNSENTIYCFVPNDFPDNEKYELPDDYYKRKIYTLDGLYSVDKQMGSTEKILNRLEGQKVYLDGVKPKLIQSKLLFKNRYNDALYQISFGNK